MIAQQARGLAGIRLARRPSRVARIGRSTPAPVRADLKNSAEADTFLNRLTEFMANSPLNQGKKMLAKAIAGNYDEAQVTAEVDGLIANNPVMLFSFSTCPFCAKAKDELNARGVEFEALELDQIANGYPIRAVLAEKTNRTSVPSIFIAGEYIGGCNDGTPGLMPLINAGELEPKLKAAGVQVQA